jgi:hypothetical protein
MTRPNWDYATRGFAAAVGAALIVAATTLRVQRTTAFMPPQIAVGEDSGYARIWVDQELKKKTDAEAAKKERERRRSNFRT